MPVNLYTGSEVDRNKSYEWLKITVSAARILKKSKLFLNLLLLFGMWLISENRCCAIDKCIS